MDGPSFTIESAGWLDGLDGVDSRLAAVRDQTVNMWMIGFIDRLQTERLNGDPIHRRTGNLANQWTPEVTSGPDSTSFSVKSMAGLDELGFGYALPLEYGAHIVPTASKWLWIPIADNLTGAGVARISPTEAREAGGHYATSRDGLGKLFFSDDGELLFALRSEIDIAPMLGAGALWEEESATLGPMIRDAFIEAIHAF